MKKLAELLIFLILSALFILEPAVFAKEEAKRDVIIKKENIKKFWLNFSNFYKSIMNEAEKNGVGEPYVADLSNIDKLVNNVRDIEVSDNNVNYFIDFINKAKKTIAQYPPIDVNQIDVASENLPGLFINQIMGLIAPFFTTTGGGLSLVSIAILTFIAVPTLPVIIVLALGVGVVGLLLGLVVGIPVALVYLVINFFTGLTDNTTAQKTASIDFDYRAIEALQNIDNINNYEFIPEYKLVDQFNQGNATIIANIIKAINDMLGGLGGAVGDIIGALTDNFTAISGIIGGVFTSVLSSLSVALPVFALFALGGFAIFALIGVSLGLVLMSPLILPLLPIILLFVALGLAVSSVGFLMFNTSMTPMSIDSVGVTFYDVVNKSVASIKGDAFMHLDIIIQDILDFAKETFGRDSSKYFDELEKIMLSNDLRTAGGIKEATFEILDFIPQIR